MTARIYAVVSVISRAQKCDSMEFAVDVSHLLQRSDVEDPILLHIKFIVYQFFETLTSFS